MYDVIVVGARCAGSTTAMLLARKGYRVLLVDRASFPSDTMSTHYIHQAGIAKLKSWGLLERLIDSNCPPIYKGRFDIGPFSLTGSPPPINGIRAAYAPRRTVLDKLLVDAAVDAGAELREGFTVQGISMDGERVNGIKGHSAGGISITEKAHFTIGADGLHSHISHMVQAPTYAERPTLSCAYYTYWSGVPLEDVELYPRDYRFVVGFPTHDDLVCISVYWPRNEFKAFRSDIEDNYLKTLELSPELAERVRTGKRVERFVGTADQPNFFRKPYGPGWALVGDAGYHKDANTAQGITDAFRDADLLADALDRSLSGSIKTEDALADYERKRNEMAMPIYELTCQLASLEPPTSEMQQFFSSLLGNQAEINHFWGSLAGSYSVTEFFSPEHIQLIIAEGSQNTPTLEQIS
jgi:flavin-dependent dehydrogenase